MAWDDDYYRRPDLLVEDLEQALYQGPAEEDAPVQVPRRTLTWALMACRDKRDLGGARD